MTTEDFIALINPAMALVFSAAFLLLWHQQQQRRYVGVLAAAYLALAGGFLLQYFSPFGLAASKLASNVLFLAGAVSLFVGALGRYAKQPPLVPILVCAGGGLTAYAWFLFGADSLAWRIFSINFACGAIALLLAAELRDIPQRKPIDNFLLGIILLWGASFFPRPVLVMWLDGPYADYQNFHQSLYWITLNFSASMFLLIFALTVITGIAFDVMDELKRESQTDPLSGLLNRRGFEEGAEALLRSARQKGMPAALIVCDLDHFKSVNDSYGHACGDAVISTFADCLRKSIDTRHIAGRIGGEEFAILLPGANISTGRLFAEGVRAAFGTLTVPGLPAGANLSASFGVAERHDSESISDLSARADLALYESKKAGRDRVRVAVKLSGSARMAPDGTMEIATQT